MVLDVPPFKSIPDQGRIPDMRSLSRSLHPGKDVALRGIETVLVSSTTSDSRDSRNNLRPSRFSVHVSGTTGGPGSINRQYLCGHGSRLTQVLGFALATGQRRCPSEQHGLPSFDSCPLPLVVLVLLVLVLVRASRSPDATVSRSD